MPSGAAVVYLAATGGPPSYPLLASHGSAEHELTLRTLFASKGWASSILEEGRRKLELKSGRHIFCIEVEKAADGASLLVFAVVVDAGYPVNFIFSAGAANAVAGPPRAMAEFRALAAPALRAQGGAPEAKQHKALRSALKPSLRPLAERFSALEKLDKLAAVQEKAFALKGLLVENLVRATERDSLLEDLEVKTRTLRDSAAVFERDSSSARCAQRCTLYKWRLMGACLGLLVAGAIAAGVTQSLGLW
jgi:hypothetical protein